MNSHEQPQTAQGRKGERVKGREGEREQGCSGLRAGARGRKGAGEISPLHPLTLSPLLRPLVAALLLISTLTPTHGQLQEIRRGSGSGGGGGGATNGIQMLNGAGTNTSLQNPTLRGVITTPLLTPDRVGYIGLGNVLTNHPNATAVHLDYLTNLTGDAQGQINNRIANLNGKGTNTDFYGALELFGSFYVDGAVTNAADTRTEGNATFISDITQPAGNTASLGNVTASGLVQALTNSWVLGTNRVRWLRLDGGQTASRALVLDSGTNVTTASGTPDGTKFLRDDNTYATPPGGGIPSTPLSSIYYNSNGTMSGSSGLVFTNGNVGIGTASPFAKSSVSMTGNSASPVFPAQTGINLTGANADNAVIGIDTYGGHGIYSIRRANGTFTSPSALLSGDELGAFAVFGYGATTYNGGAAAAVTMYANQNWSDTAKGSFIDFNTTPNNSASVLTSARVMANGDFGAIGNVGVATLAPNQFGYATPAKVLTVLGSNSAASKAVLELSAAALNVGVGNVVGQVDFSAQSQTGTRLAMIYTTLAGTTAGNYGGELTFLTKADAGSLLPRMTITEAGNVGINTVTPLAKQSVSMSGNSASPVFPTQTGINVTGANADNAIVGIDVYGGHGLYTIRRANGTFASPSAILDGDEIGAWAGYGYGSTAYHSGSSAVMAMYAKGNWSDAAKGSFIDFNTVPQNGNTIRISARVGDDGSLSCIGNGGVGTLFPNQFGYASPISVLTVMGSNAATSRAVLELAANTANVDVGSPIGQIDFHATSQTGPRIGVIQGLLSGSTVGNYGGDLLFLTKADAGALATRMTITQSGNVGIGTTDPLERLHVLGNARFTTGLVAQVKMTGGQTASRALVLDSGTNVTTASGTPDGTKFLRDDGVYATPSGAGGANTNIANLNGKGTNTDFYGAIELFDSLYVANAVTNAGDTRTEGVATFISDITQAAGNTASLGNVTASGLVQALTNAFVLGTNRVRWLRLDGGQTASRALVLDSGTNVTTATGTPDGTKFLRDDNMYAMVAGSMVTFSDPDSNWTATDLTAALAEMDNVINGGVPNSGTAKVDWSQLFNVPAGFADNTDDGAAGGGTNNVAQGIGTVDITNAVKRYWVHLNADTNVVLNWSVTNYYIVSPSNTFTISWINAPAAGAPAQSMFLELRNTNSTVGIFPEKGLNGSRVIMLAAPSTNTYTFNFDGTNFWTDSGQILATGLGDTNVFNVNPVLYNATNINPTIQDAGGVKVTFDYGSPTAGHGFRFHSDTVVTNGPVASRDGAGVTNVTLLSGATTNVTIDLGLASSNHVVFKVAMLTNSHVVLSNALLRAYPVEIVWQQDSNGQRTVLSLRSTDGLIQTNASLALTTNSDAMDVWSVSAGYFPSNVVVNSGAAVSAGGGEANVIGDAGLTNASRVSLSHSKAGVTNFLKTLEAANGLIRTNQGTNLSLAIDPAVVASQANLTAMSNVVTTASSNNVRVTAGANITVTPSGSGGIMSYAVASTGGAASTNNVAQGIGTIDLTNALKRFWVDVKELTNIVLNWSVTNYYIASPSNSFTISWINPPAAGAPAQSMFLELRNTNSAAGFFPTNGFNGTPVIMLAAPSTNTYIFNFDGTNFWIDSGQILTTGLGDTNVFNNQPVIHSPTLKGTNIVDGNIGYVEQYPAGTGGALTNFTLLVNNAASFVINGATNVSLRALYGGVLGLTYHFSIEITNGSGSNRTLEFSPVTNNWVWSYAQSALAPTTLTNSERIVIEGRLRGTNITASYAYFPWP